MDSLIIFGAKYLFVAVVLLWIMAWLQAGPRHKKQLVAATTVAIIVAAIADKICSKLYYDPRPFVSHHLHPLISHAADNGFPSEHTLFCMTLAVTLVFFRPKVGGAAIVIAFVVGASRVAAHVHSPIDIAGGALIGATAGYIGYLLSAKFLPARHVSRIKPAGDRPANPTARR